MYVIVVLLACSSYVVDTISKLHLFVQEHPGINPDCSRLGLIKTSLSTKDTTWHG